jgi:hypothetical protein
MAQGVHALLGGKCLKFNKFFGFKNEFEINYKVYSKTDVLSLYWLALRK